MIPRFALRLLREVDPRLLAKFAYTCGVKGIRSVELHKRRLKRGEYFPPFLFLSITSRCNLRCQGCWVDVEGPGRQLETGDVNRVIGEAKQHGNSFFGILGGEPFLHPGLFDILAAHPDCYFLLFTNGHFITDEAAARLRALGNASPLVSIEGGREVSDDRRGGPNVYERTLAGLENCRRHRLVVGAATSVCQSNLELVSEAWLRTLISMGVHYAWYYTYRAVGPSPAPHLALTPEQLLLVRQHDRPPARATAHRHRRRVLGRPGRRALSHGDRHEPPHRAVRGHRTLPDHPVRQQTRSTTRAACST